MYENEKPRKKAETALPKALQPFYILKSVKDEDSKQFIETEKILTSNENGQVDIKWENNDGFSYQFNRQYYIQEITPPNGYRLPKDPEKIYFHFGHPDKISYPLVANIYSNEWKNSKDLSKAVEPVTVKNERFKGLQILKTDDGLGTGVSGVTFQLEVGNEKTDGTIEWQNSNQFTTNSQGIIVIAENDDNGWLYSQLDAKKVYRIRESNPAAGFIYPNESENNYYYFYKTSDAEFESKVKSKFPNAQNIIDSGLDLRIKNKKYHELTIFKTDQDDPSIPLQGSRFSLQVWNSDTFEDVKFNNKSVVYETGSDGKFKLSSQNFVFAQNTAYRLVEIIPPNGHVLDSELKVVNFFYSSDEKNFSNKPIDFVGHNLFESQLDKTIKNELYHDLCILKTDSKSNKPLEGAEFSLQIWDGTAYKYYLDENNKQMIFKSDLNGQIKLSNQSFKFVKGKAYRLIEIKPASGYLMPAEPPFVEFYFGDEDLNFSKPDDFKGIDLAKTGKTEEIKNTPASRKLKIRKVDEENSSVTLSGVEFTLYKFENNQIQEVKDSSGNLIKFVTDSNGELEASEYVAKNNFEFSENVLYDGPHKSNF